MSIQPCCYPGESPRLFGNITNCESLNVRHRGVHGGFPFGQGWDPGLDSGLHRNDGFLCGVPRDQRRPTKIPCGKSPVGSPARRIPANQPLTANR
jgi:hypothetical protein